MAYYEERVSMNIMQTVSRVSRYSFLGRPAATSTPLKPTKQPVQCDWVRPDEMFGFSPQLNPYHAPTARGRAVPVGNHSRFKILHSDDEEDGCNVWQRKLTISKTQTPKNTARSVKKNLPGKQKKLTSPNQGCKIPLKARSSNTQRACKAKIMNPNVNITPKTVVTITRDKLAGEDNIKAKINARKIMLAKLLDESDVECDKQVKTSVANKQTREVVSSNQLSDTKTRNAKRSNEECLKGSVKKKGCEMELMIERETKKRKEQTERGSSESRLSSHQLYSDEAEQDHLNSLDLTSVDELEPDYTMQIRPSPPHTACSKTKVKPSPPHTAGTKTKVRVRSSPSCTAGTKTKVKSSPICTASTKTKVKTSPLCTASTEMKVRPSHTADTKTKDKVVIEHSEGEQLNLKNQSKRCKQTPKEYWLPRKVDDKPDDAPSSRNKRKCEPIDTQTSESGERVNEKKVKVRKTQSRMALSGMTETGVVGREAELDREKIAESKGGFGTDVWEQPRITRSRVRMGLAVAEEIEMTSGRGSRSRAVRKDRQTHDGNLEKDFQNAQEGQLEVTRETEGERDKEGLVEEAAQSLGNVRQEVEVQRAKEAQKDDETVQVRRNVRSVLGRKTEKRNDETTKENPQVQRNQRRRKELKEALEQENGKDKELQKKEEEGKIEEMDKEVPVEGKEQKERKEIEEKNAKRNEEENENVEKKKEIRLQRKGDKGGGGTNLQNADKAKPQASVSSVFQCSSSMQFEQHTAGYSIAPCHTVPGLKSAVLRLEGACLARGSTKAGSNHFGGVVLKGAVLMTVGSDVRELKQGDVMCVPPLTEWSMRSAEGATAEVYYWCSNLLRQTTSTTSTACKPSSS